MGSETIRNRQYGADYQTSRKEMTRVLKPFDLQALSIFLCIKVALVTDPACGSGGMFVQAARYMHRHNASEAEQMISGYQNEIRDQNGMRWGIVLKESGKLIGTCGFHAISDYHKRIETGYDLNRHYWGKGFMSEALSLIIDHAFTVSDVNRIEAFVETPNTASRALLEKLGFKLEGLLREHEMCRGNLIDIQILSLLRKDRKAADGEKNRQD